MNEINEINEMIYINDNIKNVYEDIKTDEYVKNFFIYKSYERLNDDIRVFTIEFGLKYYSILPSFILNYISTENLQITLKEIIKRVDGDCFKICYYCNITYPSNISEILSDYIIKIKTTYIKIDDYNTDFFIDIKIKRINYTDKSISVTIFINLLYNFINCLLLDYIKNKIKHRIKQYFLYKKKLLS
jgi:hypothetical protein